MGPFVAAYRWVGRSKRPLYISIFDQKLAIFVILGNKDKNCILIYVWFFWLGLIIVIALVIMSAKLATPGLFKITIIWNKCYDVII